MPSLAGCYQAKAPCHRLIKSKGLAVLFIDDDHPEPWMLIENLPWNVAATFSSVWRDELGGLEKRTVSNPTVVPGTKNSLVIKGGNFDTYQEIINWMLLSCRGFGVAQWPDPNIGRFTNAYLTRLCAHHIGCDYLVEAASKRMERISNAQIHSEDCRALWMMTPADEEMKQFLVAHIAERLWEKTLRAKASFWRLREELPDLDEAIRAALGIKAAAHKERKEKEAAAAKQEASENGAGARPSGSRRRYARNSQQTYRAQQPQQETSEQDKTDRSKEKGDALVPKREQDRRGGRGGNTRQARDPKQQKPKQAPTGQEVQETQATEEEKNNTIILRAEVVRKRAKGRPAYAKLDLASIAVTNEQFLSKK